MEYENTKQNTNYSFITLKNNLYNIKHIIYKIYKLYIISLQLDCNGTSFLACYHSLLM